MPGIEELLRVEGEHWRTEVDAHHQPAAAAAAAAPAAAAAAAAAAVSRPDRRPWATPRGRVWTVSIGGVAAAAVAVLAVGLSSGSGSAGNSAGSKVAGGTEFQGRASAAGSAAARASGGGGGVAAPAASGTAPVSTALILTGSLSLTVPDSAAVDRAATRATGIADGVGGRVDADSRSADKNRSATLVLRVPNATLPAVTRQLSALGTVTSQELQTKDVTAQVADVNSRVTSARAAIAALDRLYAKAQTVKDLITVESALAARQSDLEALEAQQRSLTAQTSLATLNLSIDVRAPAVVKHHQHRSGFTGGLHHGWHAFTATAGALATAAGAVLPFAVLILLAGAATVVVRRRRPHSSA